MRGGAAGSWSAFPGVFLAWPDEPLQASTMARVSWWAVLGSSKHTPKRTVPVCAVRQCGWAGSCLQVDLILWCGIMPCMEENKFAAGDPWRVVLV